MKSDLNPKKFSVLIRPTLYNIKKIYGNGKRSNYDLTYRNPSYGNNFGAFV
jgi:hypothetical protein